MRVVGLDLSLTGTGLAYRSHDGDHGWGEVRTRRLTSPPAGQGIHDRSIRLRALATLIIKWCEGADLAVIETPAYSRTMGSQHDRSGLWWLVVASLDHRGIPVVEVATTTLKVYGLGTGRGDKDAMVAAVVRRYGHLLPDLATNDEADALLLADMGARHFGRPLTDLPKTHTRAMASPSWPDRQEQHA